MCTKKTLDKFFSPMYVVTILINLLIFYKKKYWLRLGMHQNHTETKSFGFGACLTQIRKEIVKALLSQSNLYQWKKWALEIDCFQTYLFWEKKNVAWKCMLLCIKVSIFLFLFCLKRGKIKNHWSFFCVFFVYTITQHKRRRDSQFLLVITVEGN